MSHTHVEPQTYSTVIVVQTKQNGPAAAAILAAGIGSFALGVLTILGDRSVASKSFLAFYRPTGALSGVTTVAIAVWLAAWVLLDRLWKDRNVSLKKVNVVSVVLLALSFLATFPPMTNLF